MNKFNHILLTLVIFGFAAWAYAGTTSFSGIVIENAGNTTVSSTAISVENSSGTETFSVTSDGAVTIASTLALAAAQTIADDINLLFGTGSDWYIQYDEAVDDQLLIGTSKTGAIATTDPMLEILVGATPTANQEVFGVAKGTQSSNTPLLTLDEDGDCTVAASLNAPDVITSDDLTVGDDATVTGDLAVTGTTECSSALVVKDDKQIRIGTGYDWEVEYDEGVDDQLLIKSSATAAAAITDPLLEILVGASPTANQEVFGIAKGSQSSNTALFTVDEDGDASVTADLSVGSAKTDGRMTIGCGEMLYFNQGTSWEIAFSTTHSARRMHCTVGDNTTEVVIPIKLPARTTASKGASLSSVEIYYALSATGTSASAALEKMTLADNTTECSVATVTTSYDTYHNTAGNRPLAGYHKMVLTVSTPAYQADAEALNVVLTVDGTTALKNNTLDVYQAVANYSQAPY